MGKRILSLLLNALSNAPCPKIQVLFCINENLNRIDTIFFFRKNGFWKAIFKSTVIYAPSPHLLHILFWDLFDKKTMQSWLSWVEMIEHFFGTNKTVMKQKNFGAAVNLEISRRALIIINT